MKTILLFVFVLACASYNGNVRYTVVKDLYYTDAHDVRQSGEAYVPDEGENLPGIVMVHGGGWDSRDYTDNRSIGKSLASHGYTVLNINYRFPPKYLHPAPIEDLATAIVWFKQNAKRFRLNPDKIGLWGYSAGGHITSLYALLNIGTPRAVQAVVSGGAPYDLTWYTHSPIISPYIGGRRDLKLQAYADASPAFHVKEGAPPFFIYHAKNDKLVEYPQATAFEAKMRLKGNYIKRYKVPFWGHAFAFVFSDDAVKKGVHFLDEQLKDKK
ncbi:MAG: alpha/beta hydrolase [Bacteriovoracaceae bacterium]